MPTYQIIVYREDASKDKTVRLTSLELIDGEESDSDTWNQYGISSSRLIGDAGAGTWNRSASLKRIYLIETYSNKIVAQLSYESWPLKKNAMGSIKLEAGLKSAPDHTIHKYKVK